MSPYTCHNCGQTILTTDTTCWHCGVQLSPKLAEKIPTPQPETAEREPYSLSQIGVSAGMTVLVVLVLGWVMGSLGRRPLVVVADRTSVPVGWTAVADADFTFTINLPAGWQWQEPPPDEKFPALLQNDLFTFPLSPFGQIGQQLQLLMLAANEPTDQTGFLFITRDRRPRPLTFDDAKFLLEAFDDKIVLLRTAVVDGVHGEPQVDFLIRIVDESGETMLRCQQKLTTHPQGNFLLTACALPEIYTSLSTDLHDMLASFQPLGAEIK